MQYEDDHVDVTKLKYALYCRKSTDDPGRQARSIPDQIAECKQLAERLGLNVVKVLHENRSAKKPDQRPVFTQMLKDIRKGKYDAILSWAPDRLARNMREGGEVIDMIDEQIIKDLKFVTYQFTPDPNGKMLLGMAFVLSKQYSDKLSQDVTRGVRRKLAEGLVPTPKYGYTNVDGVYYPDGSNFELLCKAWERRKRKEEVKDIAEWLNEQGFHRKRKDGKKLYITPQKLSDIFRDPFYYGVLVQTGQEVDLRLLHDSFQPAVSEEDFYYIQQHSRKSYFHTKKRVGFYPLKGIVQCSFCDSKMRVAPSTSGTRKRYLYCRCDNSICREEKRRAKRSVRMKVVFDFIYELLGGGLHLTEADYRQYYAGLKKLTDRQIQNRRVELHRKQGLLKRLESEVSQRALAIVDHQKDTPIYKANAKRIAELEPDVEKLQKEVAKLKEKLAQPQRLQLSLKQFLNLSKNAATKVKAADAVGKDAICRLIFLNLSVGDDEVVSYELREPFKTLLKNRKPPKGGVGRPARYRTFATAPSHPRASRG